MDNIAIVDYMDSERNEMTCIIPKKKRSLYTEARASERFVFLRRKDAFWIQWVMKYRLLF